MYKVDFKKPISIHFIGIGGISMSGIAELMNSRGFSITGSDAKHSDVTAHLESLGIKIFYGHNASNISETTSLVVYTAAVKPDNCELAAAVEAGIPTLDRASFLGQLMTEYDDAVAVAGTHGKTTTTSMLSLMLIEGGLDPTITVGGILDSISGNIRLGGSEHFVMEACEYTDSFLKFYPVHEIILNIEADHLDYFKDINHIRSSFRKFAEKVPAGGNLVVSCDIPDYKELFKSLDANITVFGIEDSPNTSNADYIARNIKYDEFGCAGFDLYRRDELLGHLALKVIGRHNIENAIAAVTMALRLGVSFEAIARTLSTFHGAGRRFEFKGVVNGVTIIDEYAHHPTEITNSLTAAQRYPHKTLWCIFQPHTYTRSKMLFDDFIKSLSLADKIILADIYAAREKNTGEISSKDFADALISRYGKEAYYFPTFDEIINFVGTNCSEGDLLITMGAGDVVKIGDLLTNK